MSRLQPALEAVLLVADQPLDTAALSAAVDHEADEVGAALERLARSYDDEGRGFELRQVGGGWRCSPGTRTPTWSSGSCSTASRPG